MLLKSYMILELEKAVLGFGSDESGKEKRNFYNSSSRRQ